MKYFQNALSFDPSVFPRHHISVLKYQHGQKLKIFNTPPFRKLSLFDHLWLDQQLQWNLQIITDAYCRCAIYFPDYKKWEINCP